MQYTVRMGQRSGRPPICHVIIISSIIVLNGIISGLAALGGHAGSLEQVMNNETFAEITGHQLSKREVPDIENNAVWAPNGQALNETHETPSKLPEMEESHEEDLKTRINISMSQTQSQPHWFPAFVMLTFLAGNQLY